MSKELKGSENDLWSDNIFDHAASVVTVVALEDLSETLSKLDLEDPENDLCSDNLFDDAASFATAKEFSTQDEE